MRAHRDIEVTLGAGESKYFSAEGEFFFIKVAAREFKLRIGEQTHLAMAGDYARYEKPFSEVTLINDDPTRPLQVVMVVGFGEFDRKIIQGNISVELGVRKADGSFVSDRRYTRSLVLDWVDTTRAERDVGDLVDTVTKPGSFYGGLLYGNEVWMLTGTTSNYWSVFDRDTMEFIGTKTWAQSPLGANIGMYATLAMNQDYYGNAVDYTRNSGWYTYYFDLLGGLPIGWVTRSKPAGITGDIRSVARDPVSGKYVISADDRDFYIVDTDGETVLHKYENLVSSFSLNLGFYKAVKSDHDFFVYAHGGSHTNHFFNREEFLSGTLNEITTTHPAAIALDSQVYYFAGAVYDYKWRRAHVGVGGNNRIIQMEDMIISGEAYVRGNRARLVKPEGVPIVDDFTLTEVDGVSYASGPIVKAALWAMTGVQPADDYLDYVYRADFRGRGDRFLTIINGGNETWLAAEILDDFSVSLPVEIELTVDF